MSSSKPIPNDIVKRTYEEMKFSDCLYQRVASIKVNVERLKPWINQKIAKFLNIENKVITKFVCNQLQKEKFPCPKQLHINMTGFLTAHQAQEFMNELRALLISAEESENGIPAKFLEDSSNENNTKSSIREYQSTEGNIYELCDGEIYESSSSCNRSWDRLEHHSPDHEMNDSHGKQSQRRSRSTYRRSPEQRNQRYRSRYRNTRCYGSPQRRRDILWSRNRQSHSRFEEKHKTSSSFITASAKRNRSESRDSYDTHNGYINEDTIARHPSNPFAKRSASRSPSKEYASASYLPSEIRSTYRSSSKHFNNKGRASRSVSFTLSPERLQNNRNSSASSLVRDSGRFNGGRRDDSRSSVRGSEYDRYRPRSPDRYDRYNRQSSNRSRSPRRFNGRHCPFRGNNGRRSNRWNRKRQCRERFRDGYDQQPYISPQRRFSPRRNEFRRNSPQCRDSPQRLSPERRSDLKEQNIFSPLQVSTPEHEDSTCNSWGQTKNSTVTMQSPKQSPSSSNTIHKESQDTRAEKRKYSALEESPVVDTNNDNNSKAGEQCLPKKKHKKSKHNSDDYENKETKVLDSNDDDNLENTQSELSCTESDMLDIFDENLEENLENMTEA